MNALVAICQLPWAASLQVLSDSLLSHRRSHPRLDVASSLHNGWIEVVTDPDSLLGVETGLAMLRLQILNTTFGPGQHNVLVVENDRTHKTRAVPSKWLDWWLRRPGQLY